MIPFITAFNAVKNFVGLRGVIIAGATLSSLFVFHDVTSSKVKAAVNDERNRYLLSLIKDKQAAQTRIDTANTNLLDINRNLQLELQRIKDQDAAQSDSISEPLSDDCMSDYYLRPVDD